ncbi:MAG: hypothetical protein EB164_02170, partial [Thaumarchaeota archaeon]|nr:hypothetical protein [Nitrososphaerota archaeon]
NYGAKHLSKELALKNKTRRMIPKSLAISVITGVVAAGLMGTYLQQLSSQNVVYVQGSSISGFAEKTHYPVGQSIQIQIVNSGTTKIGFSADSPGIIIRALDGTTFFSTVLTGIKLDPAQKHVFEWNQQKNDNSKILEGRYVVEISAFDESGKQITDSFTLDILK